MLATHILSSLCHLLKSINNMDSTLEPILLEISLRSSRVLYLRLDHELFHLLFVQLPSYIVGFFFIKSHCSTWNCNLVLVDKLSSLILMQVHFVYHIPYISY